MIRVIEVVTIESETHILRRGYGKFLKQIRNEKRTRVILVFQNMYEV